MELLAIPLIVLALFYAGLMGSFSIGLRRILKKDISSVSEEQPFVSVIVPARNEAENIAGCIRSILDNNYPSDRFELIVVDDHSEDETCNIVQTIISSLPSVQNGRSDGDTGMECNTDNLDSVRLQLIQMTNNHLRQQAHKKHAIRKGIEKAYGEIILTTDADCTVPITWITSMVSRFQGDTGFVSGPILYRTTRSKFSRFQALEHLGFMALGAGAIGLGHPILCSGANIAYRKTLFVKQKGFDGIDHLTSGDDDLLMQKIAYSTPWKVDFCAFPGATILTDPAPNYRLYFEQQRRWASKGGHYPLRRFVVMNVLIYMFYLSLVIDSVIAVFVPVMWLFVIAAVIMKLVFEGYLLFQATGHFNRTQLLYYFLPGQLFQIPHIILAASAGALGGYTWKGRRIAR